MAAHTSLLLVIALCAATAYSLKCYVCTAASSSSNCQTAANCTNGETYCRTVEASAGVGAISVTSITKSCALSCTPSSSGISGVSASTSCCTTDLCNGGASVKASSAATILALGSLLTILKSSVL
ncbi:lymphocyte antigen 6E-like isoform X1 [Dendrobates tinctorius]|uniref:lymphocyte antigen 6E-like isoform X1 n=1 Tax=Dendrobates tinctorius TaxID=92724 RepID=UPI003CC946F7